MENQTTIRPGMPDIAPSGEPQGFTPGTPGQYGSTNANAFAAEFLEAMSASQAPVPQAPVPQAPVPQAPVPQAPVPQAPVPQVPPVVAAPQARIAQQSPQPPPTFDRYGQAPVDPLAHLEQLPALEPVADVAQPQGMGDKANHAFAELKTKFHASRKQAEEILGKYNALVESTKGFLDEKTAFADQLNKKDEKIKQLEEDLGKIELSRSPVFQEKYDAPLDRVCDEVAAILEQNGTSKDDAGRKAYDLVMASPEALADAISNLPTLAQGEISIHAREARKLLAARDAELSAWRQSQDGLDAVSSRANDIQYAQHNAEMADRAIEILRGLAPEAGQVPAYAVTDAAFSADRDLKEQQFKDWVVRAPEEQRYAAMLEGFMAPKTYEMLRQTMLENVQLKQALASRVGFQTPRSAPTHVDLPPPPPPPPPPPQPFGMATNPTDAQVFAGEFLRQMMQ